MIIYFAGSIRGGRDDQEIYQLIIKVLGRFGAVLTEHVGGADLTERGESDLSDREIFNRDMNWLRQADVVIAEVTHPSFGVGYEICQAVNWTKAVVCLYRPSDSRRLSAIIAGDPRLTVCEYHDPQEVEDILNRLMSI